MRTFDYRAFGLRIRSALALPFAPADDGVLPDVVVELGPVPSDAVETGHSFRGWRANPDAFLLNVVSVGRILVTAGSSIRIELKAGVGDDDVLSHVQGSAFAALLQQRGMLPMHASSIETTTGAVLSIGTSGVGKSTLLGAMLARGFRMIADDVTPIALDGDGVPGAMPAYPNARLWRDSLETLGEAVPELRRVRSGLEKYYLPITAFRPVSQPIRTVLVLAVHNRDSIDIAPLPAADAMGELVRHTYRKHFLGGLGRRSLQFETVGALMQHATILKVRRPQAPLDPLRLADAIIDHIGAVPVAVAADSRVA